MNYILGKMRFQITLLFMHIMQKTQRISRFLRRCLKRVLIQGLSFVLTASKAEVVKRFVKKMLGMTSVLMPDFLSDGIFTSSLNLQSVLPELLPLEVAALTI